VVFVETDYIVVGTGSAGCVVANRLSADPGSRVVVQEAGPRDKDKLVHIPAAVAKLFHSEVDWDYLTEPQKELNGRQIYWPTRAGWAATTPAWWIHGYGFAASTDCGSPTHR
jgi:choline dehydrogenase-like flavoprotein